MKNDEKKGLLGRLTGGKKEKKNSCCCNFRIEEIPEEELKNKDANASAKNNNSCCSK